VNDTPAEWRGDLQAGFFTLDGGHNGSKVQRNVVLPPNSSTPLTRFARAEWLKLGTRQSGVLAVLSVTTVWLPNTGFL